MLIEALIGILIFSIGILALIAMQATAVRSTQDARYRTEAVNYANDLLGRILVNVKRTADPVTLTDSLSLFAHRPTTAGNCSFSGAESKSAVVTEWAGLVTGATTGAARLPLPGTTAEMVQVLIDTTANAYNMVTITICWKAPDDPVARKHILVSYVT
jgi:type IV pilus assembly protein PilV